MALGLISPAVVNVTSNYRISAPGDGPLAIWFFDENNNYNFALCAGNGSVFTRVD